MSSPVTQQQQDKMCLLRQQGMSNYQIAKEMSLNYYTVLKHLGKQPAMCRAAYGSVVAKATDVEPPKPEAPKMPVVEQPKRATSLKLVSENRVMDGMFMAFSFSSDGYVTMKMKEPATDLRYDKTRMEAFVNELIEAYTELCKCCRDQ